MTLTELQNAYKEEASRLGEYGLLSKTELANGYCDADEALAAALAAGDQKAANKQSGLQSAYFAALVVRYWYKIFEWMNNSSSLLVAPEEYVDWLTESLSIAFRYRTWRYPFKVTWGKHSHEVTGFALDENGERIPNPYYWETDPNAPDKIFNRCIFSARGRAYQFANKQKRKDGVHKLSLDTMYDEEGDFAMAQANAFVEDEPMTDSVSELIQRLLARGEFTEALIIEGIARADTFKEVKKAERQEGLATTRFDPRKLVKHLNSVDGNYLSRFIATYSDGRPVPVESVAKFQKMNNTKLYKCIEKTLEEIKQTPALLECLQN